MLKVVVELHPFGSEKRKRDIGELYIVNDGTGNRLVANYEVYATDPRADERPLPIGRVENYVRNQPVWNLVEEAMRFIQEDD